MTTDGTSGRDATPPRATDGQEIAYVRCPSCAGAFASPLQVDRATLESLVPEVTVACPHCGRERTFRKADHWYELPGGS